MYIIMITIIVIILIIVIIIILGLGCSLQDVRLRHQLLVAPVRSGLHP